MSQIKKKEEDAPFQKRVSRSAKNNGRKISAPDQEKKRTKAGKWEGRISEGVRDKQKAPLGGGVSKGGGNSHQKRGDKRSPPPLNVKKRKKTKPHGKTWGGKGNHLRKKMI